MNLLIDIGNSFAKIAVFKGAELQLVEVVEELNWEAVKKVLANVPEKVNFVLLSAVKKYADELDDFFSNCFKQYIRLSHQTPLPLKLAYDTPTSLGMDRIAAAAGAQFHFPGGNVLVIDAGTCITYEFLDEKITYRGGAISPGIQMRLKALHNFTDQLPLIEWKLPEAVELIGKSTEQSILSGVLNGAIAEVEGIIHQYQEQFGAIQLIITGGDTTFFEKVLKKRIFADPNLVLQGLNQILQYNIED